MKIEKKGGSLPLTGQDLLRHLIQAYTTLMDGQAAYLDAEAGDI